MSAALPGRMMGNACRKDLVLWPQRAFACVPMSWVGTFYRTGHWPQRAVLAGPLTAHPGDCMHVCVSGVLISHDVTRGPNPAACSRYHSPAPGTVYLFVLFLFSHPKEGPVDLSIERLLRWVSRCSWQEACPTSASLTIIPLSAVIVAVGP